MTKTCPGMDSMCREAVDQPRLCCPKMQQETPTNELLESLYILGTKTTWLNVLLTSPAEVSSTSSSLATTVNSLVKKMSSGITGICTSLSKKVEVKDRWQERRWEKSLFDSPGKAIPVQTTSAACSGSTSLRFCQVAFSYRGNKIYTPKTGGGKRFILHFNIFCHENLSFFKTCRHTCTGEGVCPV